MYLYPSISINMSAIYVLFIYLILSCKGLQRSPRSHGSFRFYCSHLLRTPFRLPSPFPLPTTLPPVYFYLYLSISISISIYLYLSKYLPSMYLICFIFERAPTQPYAAALTAHTSPRPLPPLLSCLCPLLISCPLPSQNLPPFREPLREAPCENCRQPGGY